MGDFATTAFRATPRLSRRRIGELVRQLATGRIADIDREHLDEDDVLLNTLDCDPTVRFAFYTLASVRTSRPSAPWRPRSRLSRSARRIVARIVLFLRNGEDLLLPPPVPTHRSFAQVHLHWFGEPGILGTAILLLATPALVAICWPLAPVAFGWALLIWHISEDPGPEPTEIPPGWEPPADPWPFADVRSLRRASASPANRLLGGTT